MHVPLDHYSEYSTSTNLAKSLGISIERPFSKYQGSLSGVIGTTECQSLEELQSVYSKAVGHVVSLYKYGDQIKNGKVAVIGGGGNLEVLNEIFENDIFVFVTGITKVNEYSKWTHEFAQNKGVSILGGTHYSSEKFACQKMCEYFKGLGIESEFIEGNPILEDL